MALASRLAACRQGRYNLDPDIKFFAVPPVHGTLAKYTDHPADCCFKLPESLSYEQGAMVEPLSCAGQHPCWQESASVTGVSPGFVCHNSLSLF